MNSVNETEFGGVDDWFTLLIPIINFSTPSQNKLSMHSYKIVKYIVSFLATSLILHVCYGQSIKQVDDTEIYCPLKCGLYINQKGDLAFKTEALINEKGDRRTRYINWIYGVDRNDTLNGGLVEMKFVIDTSTFKFLNGVYWRDQNNIYILNPMSDGGTISMITEIDPATFKILGNSWYAKDKKKVYFKSSIVENADLKSFKPILQKGFEFYAFDKQSYYFYGEKMSDEKVKQSGVDKLKKSYYPFK